MKHSPEFPLKLIKQHEKVAIIVIIIVIYSSTETQQEVKIINKS